MFVHFWVTYGEHDGLLLDVCHHKQAAESPLQGTCQLRHFKALCLTVKPMFAGRCVSWGHCRAGIQAG